MINKSKKYIIINKYRRIKENSKVKRRRDRSNNRNISKVKVVKILKKKEIERSLFLM